MTNTLQKRQAFPVHYLAIFGGLIPLTVSAQNYDGAVAKMIHLAPKPFMIGLLLMSIALVMEWRKIYQMLTLSRRSLAYIERRHPYLMTAKELTIALLFSAAFGIFLTTLVMQTYILPPPPASMLNGYAPYSS